MSLLNVVETRRLLYAWSVGSLLLFSATFYIRVLDLSRLMMTAALIIALLFLLIERAIFYRLHIRFLQAGGGAKKVAIYGAGVVGKHLAKRIYHSPALGLNILGFLDDDKSLHGNTILLREVSSKTGVPVLGGEEQLSKLKAAQGLSEVYIALPTATYERNHALVEICGKLGLSVSVVPPTFGRLLHSLEVQELGGIPILREKKHILPFYYPFAKRCFDIIIATAALLLLSPLAILLAILIKYDSKGPIFFKQKRCGLRGRPFSFYKFRTMYAESNPYALTPQSALDPRITPLGKWLRRTSLDELPQFLNVIKGDMSVVGPRPEMPFIVESYNEEQRERLKVKPGITGIWQISAVRGEPIHSNIEYDLFYIENQSLLLDVIIVLKTVVGAIRGIGAF
jgi:exopolysaccharide biosynthesis polyprenyl glycosylphosphotransferase